MIISTHIPRTAGSSFRHFLEDVVGDGLIKDGGTPYFVPPVLRHTLAIGQQMVGRWTFAPRKAHHCVHGHFMPYKYRHLLDDDGVKFITWMRDPVDRVISHYQFCIDEMDKDGISPFQRKVAKEQWSLEAFVEHRYNQNLYTQYLWRFPIERFDFIGIVEHYKDDLQHIASTYFDQHGTPLIHDNRSTAIHVTEVDRTQILALNEGDTVLYDRALEARAARVLPAR